MGQKHAQLSIYYTANIRCTVVEGKSWTVLLNIFPKFPVGASKIGFSHVDVTLFSLYNFQRSCEWTTELSLYSSGLKVCPSNAKIHYNLAKILADQGQIAEAEKEYREAVR